MDTDLDTLATALYVTTDDLLTAHPERVPARPKIGFKPQISDAELLTLAVMQALLGFAEETRFLRYARKHLQVMFPTLPGQSGYNKRLRALAPQIVRSVNYLAFVSPSIFDGLRLLDSTPVPCGASRETGKGKDGDRGKGAAGQPRGIIHRGRPGGPSPIRSGG